MHDLYDYLKIKFSAIESCGDEIINDILDNAKNGEPIPSTYEKYFHYIAEDYYFDYLQGTLPAPFSVSNYVPSIDVECGFPRELYWWEQYEYGYRRMPMTIIE